MTDRERFIALNLVPNVGSLKAKRLLEAFGSLERVCEAPVERLRSVEGISPALAERIAGACRAPGRVTEELRLAAKSGCTVLTQADAEYPEPLRQIPDPPLAIYRKGAWTEADRIAVAIVGSRQPSLYGQDVAKRLAYDLAARGVTVVSGLARGIDAAAHRGALEAGGRTLAVLGNGLSSIYPLEHEELAQRIAANGAVISEYPMRMEPWPGNFPQRNRLISGLSLGVVVVEAAKRSGALITANMALEQGREVFAVPGKIHAVTSEGTHALLKQGACLVTSVEDIVDELRLVPPPAAARRACADSADPPPADAAGGGMPDEEQALLARLDPDEPSDLDALAIKTRLPVATCASALLRLELKRLVKQLAGKRFILKS